MTFRIIEDAAQAFGSKLHDKYIGTFGSIGVYSFNNNKTFTTLGGGALVAKDHSLVERARFLASQAKDPFDYYHHSEIGYNYTISPLNASLGYSSLPLVDREIRKQRKDHLSYKHAFRNYSCVNFQAEYGNAWSNRWITACKLESNQDQSALRAKSLMSWCTDKAPLETTQFSTGV